jgi:polar amino acid transport system substrate-binding protein
MQIHRNAISGGLRASLAFIAALAMSLTFVAASPASAATTLDRIRQTGHIKLGYLPDTPPFAYKTEAGGADGYSIALCNRIAGAVQKQLGGAPLAVDWVPVAFANRLSAVQEGSIDLLCAPTSVTLARREEVSFSIPTFPGGTRAVLRADAAASLRDALSYTVTSHVVWRGSPAAKTLSSTSVAVVTGTTTETWLASRIAALEIGAKSVPVPDYKTGLQLLRDHKVDLFFGDRALVLGAMDRASSTDLVVLDRVFTREPLALALARNDEDFRLLVDRTLSQLYSSGDFRGLYTKWFGEFNDQTQSFFLWNVVQQ